jgi:hypothetical protein
MLFSAACALPDSRTPDITVADSTALVRHNTIANIIEPTRAACRC